MEKLKSLWTRYLGWRSSKTPARPQEEPGFSWEPSVDPDAAAQARLKQADEGGGGGI